MPRRRSPVRTRCSAPNRPDSAKLAGPGLFMGVALWRRRRGLVSGLASPSVLRVSGQLQSAFRLRFRRPRNLGTQLEHLKLGHDGPAASSSQANPAMGCSNTCRLPIGRRFRTRFFRWSENQALDDLFALDRPVPGRDHEWKVFVRVISGRDCHGTSGSGMVRGLAQV